MLPPTGPGVRRRRLQQGADDVEDVIDDEGEDMEDFGADPDKAELAAANEDAEPPAATEADDTTAVDKVPPDPKPV